MLFDEEQKDAKDFTGLQNERVYRKEYSYLVSFQDCHSGVPLQDTLEIHPLQMVMPRFRDSRNPAKHMNNYIDYNLPFDLRKFFSE